jgi:hypothetical protein
LTDLKKTSRQTIDEEDSVGRSRSIAEETAKEKMAVSQSTSRSRAGREQFKREVAALSDDDPTHDILVTE